MVRGGGVVPGPWGGTRWVVAGVEAQGALGGGSGMAGSRSCTRLPALVPLRMAPLPLPLGGATATVEESEVRGGERAPAAVAGLGVPIVWGSA